MADSRLRQVIALIEAHVCRLVPNVKFDYGTRSVAINASPPRVVWVDDSEGDEPLNPPTDVSALDSERRIHGVWTRTVIAHCWAATEALAETLVEIVSWAVIQELSGTALPFSVVRTKESWVKLGTVFALNFTVSIPMFEPKTESATIQALTVSFDATDSSNDGLLDAGEG